ncbi:MAG: molecular chaperone HtpG, partial [Bacteroidia bacterium]
EKHRWLRVDADTIDNLIQKEDNANEETTLNEEEQTLLKEMFTNVAENPTLEFQAKAMGETQLPVVITRSEWMRRMAEMAKHGGGSPFMGMNMPETYNVILNTNHAQVKQLVENKDEKLAKQLLDLALLTQDMLKGKDLTAFIERTISMMK